MCRRETDYSQRRGTRRFCSGWTLDRLRPADRQAAAEQYVLEALRDEPGLMVEQVTLAENGGKASLTVNAVKDERRLTAEVALGQEEVTM